MLIPSDRHTKRDLAMWNRLWRSDQKYGQRDVMGAKQQEAMDRIAEFLESEEAYCSVSGGKDSIVVADLCLRSGVDVPFVYAKAIPTANPYCESVLQALRDRWPATRVHVVEVDYTVNRGLPDGERLSRGMRAFTEAFKPFGERRIMGIRQEESSSRSLSAAIHGVSTERVCRPILNWSACDVFGYLARHDLPIHPSYAMLGGGRWPRDRLRVDELSGLIGDNIGRREWEQEYYGDVLRRIECLQR